MVSHRGPIISINLESDDDHGRMWTGRMSETTAIALLKAATRLSRSYPSTWGGAFEVIKITPKDAGGGRSRRYYSVKIVLRNAANQGREPEKIEVSFDMYPHPEVYPVRQTPQRVIIKKFMFLARKNINEALSQELHRLSRTQEQWTKVLTLEPPRKRRPLEVGPRET